MKKPRILTRKQTLWDMYYISYVAATKRAGAMPIKSAELKRGMKPMQYGVIKAMWFDLKKRIWKVEKSQNKIIC